jgi:hypothetical protein
MEVSTREASPWLVGSICIAALLGTWASYFTVYAVLPHGTPLAHWGLFLLALGSTAGLIVTLEKGVHALMAKRPAQLDRTAR